MCIYVLVAFASSNSNLILLYVRLKESNSNQTLLSVRLEDSTLGDLIIVKGKVELPTSRDYGVT